MSKTCYLDVAKMDVENAEIVNWLVRLTGNHRNWSFEQCALYSRNVRGSIETANAHIGSMANSS